MTKFFMVPCTVHLTMEDLNYWLRESFRFLRPGLVHESSLITILQLNLIVHIYIWTTIVIFQNKLLVPLDQLLEAEPMTSSFTTSYSKWKQQVAHTMSKFVRTPWSLTSNVVEVFIVARSQLTSTNILYYTIHARSQDEYYLNKD